MNHSDATTWEAGVSSLRSGPPAHRPGFGATRTEETNGARAVVWKTAGPFFTDP
jgi:hypothetical protein